MPKTKDMSRGEEEEQRGGKGGGAERRRGKRRSRGEERQERRKEVLTSRESRQYQQKACLQFLHIICAQPSSLSMYTLHLGQRLIGASSSSFL